MADDDFASIRKALELEAAVRPYMAEGKNQIVTARVIRDNGGYAGPADDVAHVRWGEIRCLLVAYDDARLGLDQLRSRLIPLEEERISAVRDACEMCEKYEAARNSLAACRATTSELLDTIAKMHQREQQTRASKKSPYDASGGPV